MQGEAALVARLLFGVCLDALGRQREENVLVAARVRKPRFHYFGVLQFCEFCLKSKEINKGGETYDFNCINSFF